MQEYWDMISTEHQKKLKAIAENKSVGLDRALRNIVNYLRQDQNKPFAVPEYLRDLVTGRQIEQVIDMVSGGGDTKCSS